MANYDIPTRRTRLIETLHGVDDNGDVITCKIFEHTRDGHQDPEFYVLQYRERNRRMDRATRWTTRLSGAGAPDRLARQMADTRRMFADSLATAAWRFAPATEGTE